MFIILLKNGILVWLRTIYREKTIDQIISKMMGKYSKSTTLLYHHKYGSLEILKNAMTCAKDQILAIITTVGGK